MPATRNALEIGACEDTLQSLDMLARHSKHAAWLD